jgi:hypothetical protein
MGQDKMWICARASGLLAEAKFRRNGLSLKSGMVKEGLSEEVEPEHSLEGGKGIR